MKVLVNAISIKEGGSLVVVKHLLAGMAAAHPKVEWTVTIGAPITELREMQSEHFRLRVYPWAARSPLHVRFWYQYTMPALIRKLGVDCVFSLTNYLPDRELTAPTLLLVQHAGHFSPLFKSLTLGHHANPMARFAWGLKSRWVYRSVVRATRVVVQTNALSQSIIDACGLAPHKIGVVPHGPGIVTAGMVHSCPSGTWRIGYITKFGVQKNFDVVLRALSLLRSRGRAVSLMLTLGKQTAEFRALEEEMRRLNVLDLVDNRGDLPQSEIEALYDSLDVFVFPSLCESFGFPMVEAMTRGLPLVASDIESNREIAGLGAQYFSGDNHIMLADVIEATLRDPNQYAQHAQAALKQAARYSWARAAEETFAQIGAAMASKEPKT